MSIQVVGILGAGTMGNGIAQACAVAGSLDQLVKKEKISEADKAAALARIQGSTNYDALKAAQIVIEAATENHELKLKILKQVDALVASEVILASNTSSISITKLAAGRLGRKAGRGVYSHP